MATGFSAQSTLDTDCTSCLECSICLCRFREPKLLECLHTFCLRCLQELRRLRESSLTKLTCPLCEHDTAMEGKVVADLPSDSEMKDLVEMFTAMEELLKEQESEIMCQACDEHNQAISICMDCAHFLCQECKWAHESLVILKSHRVHTLSHPRKETTAFKSTTENSVMMHSDIKMLNVYYCNTCEQLICTTCSAPDRANPGHSIISLDEALDKCKRDIARLSARAEKVKRALHSATDKLNKPRKTWSGILAVILRRNTKQVEAEDEAEAARMREEVQRLQQEVQELHKERVRLDDTSQLVAQASRKRLANLNQTLSHVINSVLDQSSELLPIQ